MSQYDDYDINFDGELEAHELFIILSILKSQGIDINEELRGLILASHTHYMWGKTTLPPPSTITTTMTMTMSTTPILSKPFC